MAAPRKAEGSPDRAGKPIVRAGKGGTAAAPGSPKRGRASERVRAGPPLGGLAGDGGEKTTVTGEHGPPVLDPRGKGERLAR
ncbi:hypothetical protein IscW_ISCW005732 [Ixodes scapularis]|uniref:Uncharacterized protein n=1 Tax=Ixodes scapularis TaxID=6945 RepID=B7PNP1_IXOSC|nr:hypothetical protein IscW_ISCW005732 [Ixodes scapularis]|eukprot:XP_002435383.1 hypothetical protein IscW_ISCW005732 [Ixodes scapularis]